ncbi:MAG: RagB/SusD family nutrient uptake outer membrane protein [Bacteroidales bacterium]|nr:RagB/SusD family nutrient uptake outer membrane protein [Bacteroidales bacterium]MBE6234453.1 RagB/SusD family nutrient uptake outer membrane protein [Bacteroidales bacterium]
MKNIYKLIITALIALGISSCTSFLDMSPTDKVSDKVMWENTTNAEYHVNYLYSYIYDVLMGQCVAGQTEALTDMLKYGSYNYNSLCYIPSEIAYGAATTLTAGYVDSYMGYWGSWYTGISKINKAIVSLRKFGQMSDEDKVRLEAEMKFMRAFLYFDLMKRYKEIIIYDENLDAYAKDKPISSEADGWNLIQADLEYAAANLPERTASKGRLDKGMAWGFMTRAMLYAERWDLVKTAAAEVERLGYALEADYEDGYMKPIGNGNKEAIIQYQFDRGSDVTHSYDFYYTPGGDFSIYKETGGGYGTPTQEMVESYELATGGFPDWTPWHDVTTETPPYADLEPRFHASILYNGAPWKNRLIEPYVGGADGWCQWNLEREPKGRTTTGYYLRKMVDESHDVIAYSGGVQPLIVLRYAEVLLNKAEACHKTGDAAGANAAVKAIRDRVGLPYADKAGDELWAAIRQERKVELAYEGLWYWDLRRWRVAHKQYPEGLTGYQQHGLKIEKNDDGTFTYTYVSVDDQDRNFPEKMYRFPMPTGELNNNGAVDQYPEWK